MPEKNEYNNLMAEHIELKTRYKRLIAQTKKSKKMQFSQKVCVFGMIMTALAWLSNFLLLWFDKMTMSDVAIVIITIFGGFATGGYFALSGVRDCSKNKHGVKEE